MVARPGAKGDFETVARHHATDGSEISVLGFTRDPENMLVAVRRPREGDPEGERAALKAVSPARHAERVRIPVLLGHGRDDPNVHVDQSKNMASALRKAGGEVELALYENEIHGFAQEATALDFARRLEAFLAKHLAVDEGPAEGNAGAPPMPEPGS